MRSKIAFIGGGNIARSLIGGCIKKNYPPQNIKVSDKNEEQLNALTEDFGIRSAQNNQEAVKDADILVLAVKPQIVPEVAFELASVIQISKPLIISLAPGIRIENFEEWLGQDVGIIRTMTNLSSKVGKGSTVLFANAVTTSYQKELAEAFFNMSGTSIWLNKEEDINKTTPIIGCGPAYFYLLAEAMEKATIDLGISAEIASELSRSVSIGAAHMLEKGNISPVELRKMITTPKGVTDSSINYLLDNNFFPMFKQAFQIAEKRSSELGQITDKKSKNSFFNPDTGPMECQAKEEQFQLFKRE